MKRKKITKTINGIIWVMSNCVRCGTRHMVKSYKNNYNIEEKTKFYQTT